MPIFLIGHSLIAFCEPGLTGVPSEPKSLLPEPPDAKSVRVEETLANDIVPLSDPASACPSMPVATPDETAAGNAAPPRGTADLEFLWPVSGRIIQGYGRGGNDGINIAVPEGTAVKASEDGVVAYAGSELRGYGNLVLIRHPNGFVSAYGNNGSINVKRGETVKRGQTVALSGKSGNVSSPQLHFELRIGSKPVDPRSYLSGF
jgi:murein DD-endopeptidase MepM/ murein hydrolase activator NlpD